MLIRVVQFTQEGNGFRFWKALAGWLVICLAVAGVIYVGLPKIPVRLERGAGSTTFTSLRTLANSLQEDKPVTAAEIRFRAKELLSRSEDAEGYPDFQNHLLGGPIREEDSPGNFTLRENVEDLEFVGYDAAGAADEEWYMTWHLRSGPGGGTAFGGNFKLQHPNSREYSIFKLKSPLWADGRNPNRECQNAP